MAKYCKQYISNCLICKCTKAYIVQKQGLLNPLPIPNRKWMDLLLDFVIKLPKCCRRNCVFQYIFVVVDRLTKQQLYKLLKTLHTSKLINATGQVTPKQFLVNHLVIYFYRSPFWYDQKVLTSDSSTDSTL